MNRIDYFLRNYGKEFASHGEGNIKVLVNSFERNNRFEKMKSIVGEDTMGKLVKNTIAMDKLVQRLYPEKDLVLTLGNLMLGTAVTKKHIHIANAVSIGMALRGKDTEFKIFEHKGQPEIGKDEAIFFTNQKHNSPRDPKLHRIFHILYWLSREDAKEFHGDEFIDLKKFY